jgi:hypothetical protein
MPRFNQGRWVNFYAANLRRRLGPAYASAWPNEVLGRLRAWGFNTIGNWSAPALWQAHRMPYTVPITAEGAFDRISGAADGVADFPDPFSPGWPAAIENALTRLGVASRDDPWLLGYFVDNELPWGDGASKDPRRRFALVLRVLAQAGSPPAKQALIAHMKERYRSSEQWAAAWAIPSVSWETLASQPLVPPGALSQAALDDLAALSTLFAQTYYRTVALSLKRADPRHLYLGSRFAAQTPEALSACEKWCDVVSFNVYSGAFEAARLDRFDTLSKPALVGEFNFSSTDSGPFGHGLVNLASESDRAAAYSAYVRAAAADFSVIGVHWFQYLDEPAAGRLLDGENAHFGLVSVTDTPYIGFMASVRAANRGIFSIREELRPTAEGPTGLGRCAALASTESSPCD